MKQKIISHPVISCIFFAQIVLLVYLMIAAIVQPRKSVEILPEAFEDLEDNIVLENGDLVFRSKEGVSVDSPQTIGSKSYKLSSGGYELEVQYISQIDDKHSVANPVGVVSAYSKFNIESQEIQLNDGESVMTGRVYIPVIAGKCDDLAIRFGYFGTGELILKKIIITEAVRYRLTRILGFLILFCVVDLFLMCFFTGYNLPKVGLSVKGCVLIIALASIPYIGYYLPYGHDLWFHTQRIVGIAEELKNGQFPVRMNTSLNNSFGYPGAIFYCDLFLYPAGILYWLWAPLRTCYQFYMISVNAVTTYLTYYSLSKVTKDIKLRLLGTALYVLSSYRLTNGLVRAAVGEYTAMAFLPLVLVGLYMIFNSKKPRVKEWGPLAIGMAGIIHSHVLSCELVVMSIFILCIVLFPLVVNKYRILAFVKAAVICTLLCVWFIVPFIQFSTMQKVNIQVNNIHSNFYSAEKFINILQILAPGEGNEAFCTLGISSIISIVFLFYGLFKLRNKEDCKFRKILSIFVGFIVLDLIMISDFFPWGPLQRTEGLKGLGLVLGMIQFPWRLYTLIAILVVFALVILLGWLKRDQEILVKSISVVLLGSVIFSTGFYYYKFSCQTEWTKYSYADEEGFEDELYLLFPCQPDSAYVDDYSVITGALDVKRYYKENGVGHLIVQNKADDCIGEVEVPIFGYQFYSVTDEFENVLHWTVSDSNLIQLVVPAGYDGEILIKFKEPVLWRIAEIISLLTMMGTVGYYVYYVRVKRKEIKEEFYVEEL